MARSFTVQQIINKAMRKADMYNSGFIDIDNGEDLDMFNDAYTELYDTLVDAFGNYFVREQTITLTSGTTDYALPNDFYKTIGVDLLLSPTGNQYITLRPFTEAERNGIAGIQANVPSGTVRHRYVPAPTIFTDRSQTIDGVSGWEELIEVRMIIDMLSKEESDTARWERREQALKSRITIMAQDRDIGMPARVNDVYSMSFWQQYQTLRYEHNGDYMRFMNTQIVSPFVGFI